MIFEDFKKLPTKKKREIISQWIDGSGYSYMQLYKSGIISKINVLIGLKKPNWNKERILSDVEDNYTRRKFWTCTPSYYAALKLRITDEVDEHMINKIGQVWYDRSNYKWRTIDDVLVDIRDNYHSLEEWTQSSSYHAAVGHKWLDEIKSIMGWSRFRWTVDKILKDLDNYESYQQWKGSPSYSAASKLKVIDKCVEHKGWSFEIRKWTIELIFEDLKNYNSWKDWYKSKSYRQATDYKILDECCKRMGWNAGRRKWDEVDILIDTFNYTLPSQWSHQASYVAAQRANIINKIKKARAWL